MLHHSVNRFSIQQSLDPFAEFSAYERHMVSGEILAALLDPHDPDVEGIVEYCRDALQCDWPAVPVAESTSVHVIRKRYEREFPRVIQLKGFLDERCHHRIGQLELRRSLVGIPDGSTEGIESLLQSPIDTLLGFFPKVSTVMRRDHCLDIGRAHV